MKDDKKVPQLRFPEFTDAWKQRKLEQIIDVGSGRDYKHLSEGGIPVYGTGGYMLSVNEALSWEEDAIGIGRKGTIDKPYILQAPFWTVDTLFYAIPKKEQDLDFLYCIFQNIDWKKKDESTGVPSLSKTIINKTYCMTPNYDEQKKIGCFFSKIDNLITLQQRKLNSLQKLKKGLLQKMFPKNGENIPEIRFPEFSDAWKQRKLGDILKLLKDGTHGSLKDVTNGHYLLSAKNIKDGRIFWDKTDRIISDEDYKKIHSTFKINKGDVLLTIVGSIGETAIFNVSEEITFQRSVAILRPIDEVSSDFLYSEITSPKFQKFLNLNKSTSAQPGIYLGDLANISFSFPENKEEQKMIGRLFTGLNSTITLQQRKLESLQKLKKGLLQQMFI